MCEIPPMECQECGAPMEYSGGPSDSNIFIMRCVNPKCRRQEIWYAESTPPKKAEPTAGERK